VTHKNPQTEEGRECDNVLPGQACQGVRALIRKFVLKYALMRLHTLLTVYAIHRRGFFIQAIKIKYCTPGVHRYREPVPQGDYIFLRWRLMFLVSQYGIGFMLPVWSLEV
jgi:hypothetical protein